MRFFVTAAKGTEPALRDELRELRLPVVRADRGGVHFEGDWTDAYRVCLTSRVGLRVLFEVLRFPCPHEDALYEGVQSHDWSEVLSPRQTLQVSAVARSSRLTHTQYIAQRTKDAIVDQQRGQSGARSSVDLRDADLSVFVHLVKNEASVNLDLAGTSLHKRGYRLEAGEAPLKENLAAALLRYSGWDGRSELYDPMCGAGTIAIEAAAWASKLAPGLLRERFGFERWANYDDSRRRAMRELREQLKSAVDPARARVLGSDSSGAVLEQARANAARVGVKVEFSERSLSDAQREGRGAVVLNPPYGKRLRADDDLGRELARLIDRHPERNVALLMASDQQLGRTRRHPETPRIVYNGDIECVVRAYAPVRSA